MIEQKDDVLNFLLAPSNLPLAMRVLIALVGSYQQIFVFVAVFDFLNSEDLNSLYKYIISIIILQMQAWTNLTVVKEFKILLDYTCTIRKRCLPAKLVSADHFQMIMDIRKLLKIMNYMCYVVVATIIITFSVYQTGDEFEWQYAYYKFQWIPRKMKYLLYFISFAVTMLVITWVVSASVYIVTNLIFQYIILNKFIVDMYTKTDYSINDVRYQERVTRQLKRCVKFHVHIMQIKKIVTERPSQAIIQVSAMSVLTFLSASYFVFKGISPRSNFRMLFILQGYIVFVSGLCLFTQQLRNESENLILSSHSCPWNQWSMRNRKIFLIFLTNISMPCRISSFGIIDLNHETMMKIFKLGYTILTWFVNVNAQLHH